MRFVLAIVAFVAAACMIALGIAQRTVFLEPASVSLSTTVAGNGPYTVIDGDALTAHEGAQTLTVRGSENSFMAYGRTADMEAWLGDLSYTRLSYDEDSKELSSEVVRGESVPTSGSTPPSDVPAGEGQPAAPNPDPRGSDLWLDEWTSEGSLSNTINAPEGISVLLATRQLDTVGGSADRRRCDSVAHRPGALPLGAAPHASLARPAPKRAQGPADAETPEGSKTQDDQDQRDHGQRAAQGDQRAFIAHRRRARARHLRTRPLRLLRVILARSL